MLGVAVGWEVVTGVKLKGENAAQLALRLQRATELTSMDAAGEKPWHLKLEVQEFDSDGKPGETATVEEWWASETLNKVTYTNASYTGTEVRNGANTFRTAGWGGVSQVSIMMRRQMVHPMPTADEMQGAKLEERTESFGKVKLDCVMVGEEIRGVLYPPFGLFPMYCMEPKADWLRLTFDFGSLLVVRNKIGTFRERSVPLEMGANANGKPLATAKVVALQTVALTEADFVLGDELTKGGDAPTLIASGVVAGRLIKPSAVPVFPQAAKNRHASGAVVMRAILGRDGHVHQLRLKSYPDGDLAISALWAVRQWKYTPYLLKGEPVEVDTTITVNFNYSN